MIPVPGNPQSEGEITALEFGEPQSERSLLITTCKFLKLHTCILMTDC